MIIGQAIAVGQIGLPFVCRCETRYHCLIPQGPHYIYIEGDESHISRVVKELDKHK